MSRTTLHFRFLLSFWGVLALTGAISLCSGMYLSSHPGWRYAIVFLVFALLLFLLIAALFLLLLNSMLKPIKELSAAMEEIATSPNLREIKIGHAPPEIENLVGAFNKMQSAIRERRRMNQEKLIRSDRLAMIGQLAAGVAHEINNPLGSILLFTRLVMQQCAADGKMRDNLERIEKETKRCHSIVQSLLDFARQREPNIEPVDVNQLLDATINFFERQQFFQNIEIVRNYGTGFPPIEADYLQLQQVFMNIMINAVDAMDAKGLLMLDTTWNSSQGRVEISIADTGCGIPPENVERIFDPFFTTKDVGRGTGLGLSVSYGIIQAHRGEISVSSTPGRGSRFTICLPVRRNAA
jgi:two-component system NtrC family sensor kinase